MSYTGTKRGRSRGTASSSRGRPTCKNSTKNSEKISKYFAKAQKDDSDELSDSPYKNCLNEVKSAKLNNSVSDFDDFTTPKAINKVSKIASKLGQKNVRKKRTRQAPLRKFIEDNLKQSDVNPEHLQMALALSESSYEAENPQSSQEKKETFKKAFEQFGFGYSKKRMFVQTKKDNSEATKNKKSRYKYVKPVLKIRTNEQREALISSKVALILSENSRRPRYISCEFTELSTDLLKKYTNQKLLKLQNLELDELNASSDLFYVSRLGVESCPSSCGRLLRDWRRIPGRDLTPERGSANQSAAIGEYTELTPPSANKNTVENNEDCDYFQTTCLKSGDTYQDDEFMVFHCEETDEGRSISRRASTSERDCSNQRAAISAELTPPSANKFAVEENADDYFEKSCLKSEVTCQDDDFMVFCCEKNDDGRSLSGRESTKPDIQIGGCDITPPTLNTTVDFVDNAKLKNSVCSPVLCSVLEISSDDDLKLVSSIVEKKDEIVNQPSKSIWEDDTSCLINSNSKENSPNNSPAFSPHGNLSPKRSGKKVALQKLLKPSKYRLSPSILSSSHFSLTNETAEFDVDSPRIKNTLGTQRKIETYNTSVQYEHIDLCSSDEDPVKDTDVQASEDTTLIYTLDQLSVPENEASLKLFKTPPGKVSPTKKTTIFHQTPRKISYSCVSPDIFGSDEEPSSSPVVTRLKGGQNITEEECYDLTQSDQEESFHLNMSGPEDSIDRRSDLNVTEYVQNLLTQYKEEARTSGRKLEKISTSDEESQPSQNSVYISDDELNYSSVFGTSHPKNMDNLDDNEFRSSLKLTNSSEKEQILKDFTISPPRKAPMRLPLSNISPSKVSTPTSNLEDSFNDVLGHLPVDTPSTSTTSFIIKTKNVTPMANYDEMDTPKIVKELDKFGLKPLKRQKGAKLLKYIYESTHPVVDENVPVVKKRRTLEPPPGKIIVGDIEEETVVLERKQSKRVPSCAVPLHIVWHNFVMSNPKVRDNILLYEPLQLEVLHSMLKDQGFKFNIQDLLAFLDKKCITIRTAQGQHHGKKQ